MAIDYSQLIPNNVDLSSDRRLQRARQFFCQHCEVFRHSCRDADAAVQGSNPRHSHEYAVRHQGIQYALCIFTIPSAVDGHEIGCGRQWCEAVLAGNCGDLPARGFYACDDASQVVLIGQCRHAGNLPHPRNSEMVAYLVECGNDVRMPDAVTEPHPCHAIGLGKRAKAQHIRLGHIEPGQRALWRELAVCFIQNQKSVIRQCGDHLLDCCCVPPTSHRIIGICEVDDARVFAKREVEKRGGVFVVVHIGRGDQPAPKTMHMETEGWIGALRRCNAHPRFYEQPDGKAEEPVNSLANHHV